MKIDSHNFLLNDKVSQSNVISEEFFNMRKPHLEELTKVEQLLRKHSPLNISYDVVKTQQPYFHEFTYTEAMGCLMVAPQSREATCKIFNQSKRLDNDHFDIVKEIFNRKDLDKYALNEDVSFLPKKVAFVPGSNIFNYTVSREIFTRLLVENEDVYIKPHPLTNEGLLRSLGIEFGYHRIIDPMISGSKILENCEICYVTSGTEMGLYAILVGKEISNVGNFFTESSNTYDHIYRGLWKLNTSDKKIFLEEKLQCYSSGIFHPNDINLEEKIHKYFELAMEIRKENKPTSYEMSNMDWGKIHMRRIDKE